VADGLTETEPLVDTPPTPLSIEALVAFVLVQDSVVLPPRAKAVELAEKLPVGAGIVTVAVVVLVPASPLMVSV
jgi:hypothetical protein